MFHKHRELLMCRGGTAYKRLDLLRKLVLPSLLFNIGTCHLKVSHLHRLRGVEDKMMRRVYGWRMHPKHDTADQMTALARTMKEYRKRAGLRRWDEEALLRAHSWAGLVARFGGYAPERLAYKALCYSNINYLRTMEGLYGQQCHGRHLKVWRWEQQFTMILGDSWQEVARTAELWEDSRNFWLTRRKHSHVS